jgi:hypothetical protein
VAVIPNVVLIVIVIVVFVFGTRPGDIHTTCSQEQTFHVCNRHLTRL